ncbi:MAG: cytochrome c oxidase assembly protein [Caulobacterales bacterium]
MSDPSDAPALKKRFRFSAAMTVGVVLVMLSLSFAAVPLYDAFCKATGWGGETQVAKTASTKVLDRTMEVRFDANTGSGAPFEFKPDKTSMTLKVGETGLAFFRLKNLASVPITAQATYNVTPDKAGIYFQKLQCFCFTPKTFAPGETLELPVLFYVDPKIAVDKDAEEVRSITLSYTYFGQPGQNAAGGKATATR